MAIITKLRLMCIIFVFLTLQRPALSSPDLAALKKDQALSDFRVANLYSDSDGRIVALKVVHVPTGAPVFFLQLETVPQVLTWVDSPVDSNRGLPHSLEHLLVVKGTKGRYLNLLRDMRLSQSGAATFPDTVCYGFSSGAGVDGFFEQFHALLEALYHPDFTDAEAEREFYHFAVANNGETEKTLIEGGTVYDEMLATQNRYTYNFELYKRVLGEQNPFTFDSAGVPEEMRDVKPDEIRRFHDKYYNIGPNTGFIFAFPPKEKVLDLIQRISQEFRQFSRSDAPPLRRAVGGAKYPVHPSENLDPAIYPYPGSNETGPGFVHFAWKPAKVRSRLELRLLDLFSNALAGGEDSLLHQAVVDSRKRVIDSGATAVGSTLFLNNSPDFPFLIVEVAGIPGNRVSVESVGQLRMLVMSKIREIARYPDRSKSLADFDQVVASYAKSLRRSESVWTKNAPGFGSGVPKIDWKLYFEKLESDPSFVRSLSADHDWQTIDEQLRSGKNLWRALIESFHLLETPYATATAPSSKLLEQIDTRRHERVKAKVAVLMEQYRTGDEQEAISRFEREELIKTSEIEKVATKVPPPRFTDHPPMTPDDQIQYRQFDIENVPVIASFFDRPPTIDIGLSFDLRNVPHEYYKYLPLLSKCLDSLGLKQSGEVIPYSGLVTRIQKEVFALSTGYELNPTSKRADLTIRASAVGLDEFRRALNLIRQMMESNDLDLSNADRLRDIVARSISADHLYARQDVSTLNAAYSFHHQDDPLFFSLNSRFAGAHWDERLKWLLHVPVDSKEVDKLVDFANDFLSASSLQSRRQVSKSLDTLKVEGLERELVEYWKSTLSSFPESELINGLRQLAAEVSEDLRVGPARTIENLKSLQRIVLNRNTLHLDLTLSESSLGEVRGDMATFLRSVPALPLESESAISEPSVSHLPIIARLKKRYGLSQERAPWYVGFVNPDRTAGDAIFYSNFPSYSQVDRESLKQVLAAKIFSGGGPRSFYMKSSAAGLAYNSFIRSDPAFGLTWYYAYRSPDIASLIRLVNSTVSEASTLDDSSIVDHVLSQTFSFSRSAATFSERGRAAAQDIRDGNEPEKIRRFSEAILRLRQEPDLLAQLAREAPISIGGVLVDEKYIEQHRRGRSLFFFVGSEEILSDTERRLSIPKLLRVWPSDFWIE